MWPQMTPGCALYFAMAMSIKGISQSSIVTLVLPNRPSGGFLTLNEKT